MKRLLLILLFIVFVAQPCLGALSPSIDNRKTWKNAYRFTGKPKDLFTDWCEEVEDALDGTSGVDSLLFSGLSTSAGAALTDEGILFYDTGTDNLKYRNASTLVTLATSTSGTMDETYNQGSGITVDTGTVTLTGTDALNAEVLAIVHAETGVYPAVSISNAGTDPTIEITTSGSGADITGTSVTWSISKTGIATFGGGGVWSTCDVLFDATSASEDVQWDEDAQMMHFLDGAILGLGGAVNAAADMTFESDGTNVLVEVATQDGADLIFGSTEAFDFKIHGNTNTLYALFDGSEAALVLTNYDIWCDDDADVFFGTTKNIGFLLAWDSSKTMSLLAGAASDDFAFNIGVDQSGVDLGLYGTTAGAYMLWDSSDDALWFDKADISFSDGDGILFGDSLGAGDVRIDATSAVLTIDQVIEDVGTVAFGADGNSLDVTFYGDTASAQVLFDEDADQMVVAGGYQITLNDDVELLFGTGSSNAGDFSIVCTTTPTLVIDIVAAYSAQSIEIGNDADDVPLKWFGETASAFFYFIGDQLQVEGAGGTASIALGDGDAILFGDSLGTGYFKIAEATNVLAFTSITEDTGSYTWGVDANGTDTTWFGELANSYMKWDASSASKLLLVGVDNGGTILAITGVDASGDSDTVTIAHGGSGDAIQITLGNTDSMGVRTIAAGSQTTSMMHFDASTNNWDGAPNIGMLHLVADDPFFHANASMIMAVNTGTPIANAGGFMLRLVDTGSNQASTAYAAVIASTSNEAMHIDAGKVLIDESLIATLGIQVGVGETLTAAAAEGAGQQIDDGITVANVTASGGATDYITLPNDPTIGTVVKVMCNVGSNFEIRTLTSGNDKINNVDTSDNAVEYLATDTDMIIFTCLAADNWVATSYPRAGGVRGAITPD
ncbi:MAG TPA: hypothetical protein ENI05_06195 [Porticoccus sp.]|nr:hypothetical protein [Porticoccus sp.]